MVHILDSYDCLLFGILGIAYRKHTQLSFWNWSCDLWWQYDCILKFNSLPAVSGWVQKGEFSFCQAWPLSCHGNYLGGFITPCACTGNANMNVPDMELVYLESKCMFEYVYLVARCEGEGLDINGGLCVLYMCDHHKGSKEAFTHKHLDLPISHKHFWGMCSAISVVLSADSGCSSGTHKELWSRQSLPISHSRYKHVPN